MSTPSRPSKQSPSVIAATVVALEAYKKLADGAVTQTSDESLRRPLSADVNSIAVIMKHMAGNMLSRWTNFLHSDGEKPDRNRDGEFVDEFPDRGEPHHVIDAIQRQIAHYGYHVGQIIQIARVHAGDDWKVLTIPRGGSEQFNNRMGR